MKTRYPFQIDSVVHKSKNVIRTFGMDAMLFSPPEETEGRNPSAPLEMHEGYSRFKGTLISKEGSVSRFATFNIPAKSVPYIHKKTTMIMENNLRRTICLKTGEAKKNAETAAGSATSAAYTVKITSPLLKGKTAVQALLESAENKTILENQIIFLENNLAKYPANKTQIDAINEALALFTAGEINQGNVTNTENEVVEVYTCPPKNIQPVDGRGYYTVYDVTVLYDGSKKMPFEVSVMNCLAPVDKSEGNKILMNKADNKKTISMSLSESEWFGMIDTMKSHKIMFESMTYPEQLKLAKKISNENRTKAE